MESGVCFYCFYSNMLLLFAVAILLNQACRHKLAVAGSKGTLLMFLSVCGFH